MTKCRLLEIGMRIPTFRICNCLLQLWMGFAGPFLGAQGIQILLDFQSWHWNFNPKFYIHIYAAWLEVTSLATRLVLRWSDHLNWWSTKDWSWQQKKKICKSSDGPNCLCLINWHFHVDWIVQLVLLLAMAHPTWVSTYNKFWYISNKGVNKRSQIRGLKEGSNWLSSFLSFFF